MTSAPTTFQARNVVSGSFPPLAQPDHAMQAAIEGAGVVLGWRSLAPADLEAARLVVPFDLPLPMEAAFREWMLGETRARRRGAKRRRPHRA